MFINQSQAALSYQLLFHLEQASQGLLPVRLYAKTSNFLWAIPHDVDSVVLVVQQQQVALELTKGAD